MAEIVGLVVGVIGLLPVCATGFTFIENIIKHDRRVEEQVIRIQIQRWVGSPMFLSHRSNYIPNFKLK